MTAYLSRAAFAAAAMAFGLPGAQASTYSATGDLSVSLQVTATCSVTTSPVSFGANNASDISSLEATGSITVKCSKGTHYDVDLGVGGNASGNTRMMRGMKGGTVAYNLYCDSSHSKVWGAGMSGGQAWNKCVGGGVDSVGAGTGQEFTVYAAIPADQGSVAADNYADTVLVTISY